MKFHHFWPIQDNPFLLPLEKPTIAPHGKTPFDAHD